MENPLLWVYSVNRKLLFAVIVHVQNFILFLFFNGTDMYSFTDTLLTGGFIQPSKILRVLAFKKWVCSCGRF